MDLAAKSFGTHHYECCHGNDGMKSFAKIISFLFCVALALAYCYLTGSFG